MLPDDGGGEFVSDLRVVVRDVAAGLPLRDQRCAPCNVQFACREHVLSEAQLEVALAARNRSGTAAVQLRPPVRARGAQ